MNVHRKNFINKKIVVLIPARGGSKRVKSKNLYMIGSRPLMAWSIEAARKEKIVDKIFVSTDDKNISFYARHYGAEIHKRKKKYSGDNSHISETIKSFIKYLREEVNYKPEILPRSQDAQPIIQETTGLYGIKKKALFRKKCRIGFKPILYPISASESVDLDTINDFNYLNKFLKK